jgi:class 3 adenylate cyclase/tetratricopeptide (TPR) repeat protein
MPTQMLCVVFTDIVDSTGLWTRLGPHSADIVRREHFTTLRETAARHGGREVKNLGDGLMVAFTSPSAALAAVVAMQQAVERQNRDAPEPIGLRIGISVGEILDEDGDSFGDPVVEAARLCAAAEGGEILVAAAVRTMAGRRVALPFTDLGDLALKGLPDPTPTLRLHWVPSEPEPERVPLPARLAGQAPVLFGRTSEQEWLGRALSAAVGGRRQVVFIGGEPGIGKTTLTADLARRAAEAGAAVCYGRAEKDMGIPYQPFIEALQHYVEHAPADVLRTHVDDHGGELTRLVPALARQVPDCPPASTTDPDTERYLTFGAVTGLLERATAVGPMVLVLDDLHWADMPTVRLLRYVTGTLAAGSLLLIGTYRSTEVTESHPLADALVDLRREPGVSRIDLTGLTVEDVGALVASAAGHAIEDPASARLIDSLARDTGGNPFFVWEMIRHVVDSGGVVQDAGGRWTVTDRLMRSGLPQGLHDVVGQRVSRLGANGLRLLSLAAVMGNDIEAPLLSVVAEMGEDEVLELLDEARTAAIVTEAEEGSSRFSFVHAIIANVLYDRLGVSRRARAHRKIAEAMEAHYGKDPAHAAQVAYHWIQGHDDDKALEFTRRAGMAALDALAPDEAVRWLEDALGRQAQHRPDDLPLRCDLLTALGSAQELTGDPAFRKNLLDASRLAADLDDPERLAAAVLANNRGNFSATGTVDEERLEALEAALARASDPAVTARLFATACIERYFGASYDERLAMLRRAKELTPLDDPATAVSVYNLAVEVVRHPAQLAERLEDTALLLSLAEGLGDPAALLWAVGHRMRATFEAGMVEESEHLFSRLQSLAAEIGQPALLWQAGYSLAQRTLLHGDHAEGERLATAAFELASSSGEPDALAYYLAQMDQVLWLQGRGGEVADSLAQGLEENPGLPAFGAALARALAQGERWDEAARVLGAAASDNFTCLRADMLWSTGTAMYAEAAIQLHEPMAAAMLFEQLRPYPDQIAFTGATCEGAISHYLGALATVLGRYDEAEAYFDAADRWNAAADAPFMACRTQVERGRMLLRRRASGDGARAATILDGARRAADARGFGGVSRLAAALVAGADTPEA